MTPDTHRSEFNIKSKDMFIKKNVVYVVNTFFDINFHILAQSVRECAFRDLHIDQKDILLCSMA